MPDRDPKEAALCRRAVLGAGLAAGPFLMLPARADDAAEPAAAPPQAGDHFVFLTGPKTGQPVLSEDLPLGGPQVQAYPAAPDGTVRNATRLNLVILARIGDNGVDDVTLSHMADGVVAYSGVCTHQACPVNMWSNDTHAFVCSCHGSVYDPRNGAEVLDGPAPRHLAALPLTSKEGMLMAAGGFTGRVGMQMS
jgi:rieske iron-sulfur protein